MRRNSGIIGPKQEVKPNNSNAVKMSDLHDVHTNMLGDNYPVSVSVSSYAVTAEKSSTTLTLNNSNWVQNETMTVVVITNAPNRTLYWSVGTGSGGTNFFSSNPSSGSFTTQSNGIGSFELTTDFVGFSQTSDETVDLVIKSVSNGQAVYTITATVKAPVYSGSSNSLQEGNIGSFQHQISYIGHSTQGGASAAETFYFKFIEYTINGTAFGSLVDMTGEITSTATNYNFTALNANSLNRGVTISDSVTAVADLSTEGNEVIRQHVGIALSGGAVSNAGYAQITVLDTSLTPNVTTNTASATTIAEGSSVTFNYTDSANSTGTVYWRAVGNIDLALDINNYFGSFNLVNGSGSVTVTALSDSVSEGTEYFYITYRKESTVGTIIANSPTVNITNVAPDISANFVAAIPAYAFNYSSSGDSTSPYNVFDFNVPSGVSGSKRIYIGVKCTHGTTYRNDVCVAGLQILNSAGTAIQRADIFSVGTESYQTVTARIRNSSATGFAPISTATGATYSNIANGSTAKRFNRATGTGSTYTGMADGISTAYNSSTILPSPSSSSIYIVSQTSGTYYHYIETSGVTRYDEYVMRSPAYTFSGGEIIRLCAQLASVTGYDIDNTLFLAIA